MVVRLTCNQLMRVQIPTEAPKVDSRYPLATKIWRRQSEIYRPRTARVVKMLLSLRIETLCIRPIGVIKGCSNYPLYVPIGKLAKPVPFQGTDTGSNPVGGTKVRHTYTFKSGVGFGHFSKKEKMTLYGSVGKLVNPPACHAGDSEFKPRRGRQKNVTSYDNGRVVLVNKPFFWQVEDKRTCIMAW